MKIDVYANDGSPLGISPPTIYGRGVGGAELSLMTWAEEMAKRGHQVRIYNNPDRSGDYDGVDYLPQADFRPSDPRDVFVVYRSPNRFLKTVNAGVKIHWSTDQYTMGNYGNEIVPFVDAVVCISPFHLGHYKRNYTNGDTKCDLGYIDLGVRMQDYDGNYVERVKNRFIFCSVPDRGLPVVKQVWPAIKQAIPDATLVITSDYTLWGAGPTNHQHRMNFLNVDGVSFLGAIPRKELAIRQMEAEVLLYPCVYQELFCISAAECQFTGAIPITTAVGALETTNQFGIKVSGMPDDPGWVENYIDLVIDLVNDRQTQAAIRDEMMLAAANRFRWERICSEWESLLETGQFRYQNLEVVA